MVKLTSRRRSSGQARNKPATVAAAAKGSTDGSDSSRAATKRVRNRSQQSAKTQEKVAAVKADPPQAESHIWPPHQSALTIVLPKGLEYIEISKGCSVMYLGCASLAVSYLADMVGKSGCVYAIESGAWVRGELLDLSKRLRNVVAIGEDPLMPYKYHRLVDSVDFLFCDTVQREQVRILILHARHFLRPGGHFTISLPGAPKDCNKVVNRLHAEQLETLDRVSLQPQMRYQTILVGVYNLTVPEYLNEASD